MPALSSATLRSRPRRKRNRQARATQQKSRLNRDSQVYGFLPLIYADNTDQPCFARMYRIDDLVLFYQCHQCQSVVRLCKGKRGSFLPRSSVKRLRMNQSPAIAGSRTSYNENHEVAAFRLAFTFSIFLTPSDCSHCSNAFAPCLP